MAIINISPEEPKDEAFRKIETILGEKASEATLQQVKTDLASVKQSTSETKTNVAEMKTKTENIKTDVTGMKIDVASIKTNVTGIKTDMADVKTNVTGIKTETASIQTGVTGIHDKVGTKEDGAGVNTLFGKLNSLTSSLISHMGTWTDARLKKIDGIGIASDSAASSATPHTGADTATGSVHAKLNRLFKFTNSCNDLEYIKKTYSHLTTYITGNRMAKYDTIGWTGDTINGGDAYLKENATIHSKLNRIFQYTNSCNDFQYLKSAYELGTRGTVKSVQRGITVVTGTADSEIRLYADQIINSVDLNKAILHVEMLPTNNVATGGSFAEAYDLMAGGKFESINKIRIYISKRTYIGTFYVPWQVVEFY